MPKPHNNRTAAVGSRLARQRSGAEQSDPRRLILLEKILEESSSIALNDGANQTSAAQALELHSSLLELVEELIQVESAQQKRLPTRNEESWAKFFGWIDEELKYDLEAGTKMSSLVGVEKMEDDECSLVARIPIKKGDNVFSVHRKVMLSTETAARDVDLHDFIKRDKIASSMQNVVLVLHLLNEYSKGSRSNWYPYLSILPSKILPILTMTRDKLDTLKSSAHIFEALKMIRAITRQYAYFYKRLELTNLPLRRDFTFEYYTWGVSIVCSRQNEIPSTNNRKTKSSQLLGVGPVHALIPILDMCNHDAQSNQAIFESSQTQLKAHKDLESGDVITLNYGSRSSGEFFIHNGFVPEEVPNDMLPLTIALNDKDSLYDAKLKLLKTFNMLPFGRFRLMKNNFENRHRRDPHLTMFLIVYFLNTEEMEFIQNSANPVGVADELYEFVQYSKFNGNQSNTSQDEANSDDRTRAMKMRLEGCVQDYLSKRGSIGSALIDHTLERHKCHIDIHTSRLLKHEQSILGSYIIKHDV